MAYTFAQVIDDRALRDLTSLNVDVPYEGQFAARAVELWSNDCVYVFGCYMDDPALYATPLDLDGNCLMRIPVTAETQFYDDEEVAQIDACIEASEQLLREAR